MRLGAAGNRVLFVENPGVRTPRLGDARRIARRLRNFGRGLPGRGVRDVAPNVHACAPLVLPPFGPGWRRALNRRVLLPRVAAVAAGLGLQPTLLWTFLPTDTVLGLADLLAIPPGELVYYCVADFPLLASDPAALAASEREVVGRSGAVFASCETLARRFRPWNPSVHVVPFGVRLDAFRPDEPADADAAAWPRPVVGYVGGLHVHVDMALVTALARARPRWTWVYVGAVHADVEALRALPNVRLLGPRPHAALARVIAACDVCTVPYRRSAFTETVVPTKINEYLAMGKPVVSTDLPTVRAFEERHRVLWTAPPDPGAFLAAIEDALATPRTPEALAHRRAVAAQADWGARLAQMSAVVEAGRRARDGEGR